MDFNSTPLVSFWRIFLCFNNATFFKILSFVTKAISVIYLYYNNSKYLDTLKIYEW